LRIKSNIHKAGWGLLIACLAILSGLFFAWLKSLLGADTGNAESINQQVNINLAYLLMPLLISPVIEEWIFRKSLPGLLQRKLPKPAAIILSNILFAILHGDWFIFPYFVNGCLYAYSYERTGDLRVPVFSHVLYNAFVFATTYIFAV